MNLLRGHIRIRAHRLSSGSQCRGFGIASNPEVAQLQLALFCYEQIRWFQVAMNNAGIVSMFEGSAELLAHLNCLLPVQPPAFLEYILQRAAIDVLHRVVALKVLRATAIILDDVRMVHSLQNVDFAFKSLEQSFVGGQGRGEHFQGDFFPCFNIRRQINNPPSHQHPAGAQSGMGRSDADSWCLLSPSVPFLVGFNSNLRASAGGKMQRMSLPAF